MLTVSAGKAFRTGSSSRSRKRTGVKKPDGIGYFQICCLKIERLGGIYVVSYGLNPIESRSKEQVLSIGIFNEFTV